MRNVLHIGGSLLAISAFAGTLNAQTSTPIKFGIGAGLTISRVEITEGSVSIKPLENGYHVQAMVGFDPVTLPIGFRGEIGYHSLGGKSEFEEFGSFKATVLGGGVNAMWKFPTAESAIKPYITGGIGIYRVKVEIDAPGAEDESETKFGANGGGGLMFDLAGFSAFVEARYLAIFTDFSDPDLPGVELNARLIPITFGVMFGGR